MTPFKSKLPPKQFKACQNLPSGSQIRTSKLIHSQLFSGKEFTISLEKLKWFEGN